jgi:hypothetical protein
MSYAELLKKPQWQKKRLETLERDKWTCQMCGDTEANLTVHHISYRRENGEFVDVWDYPDEDLISLCELCHSKEEATLKIFQKSLYFKIRDLCFNTEAIMGVTIMLDMYKEHLGRRLTAKDIGDLCLSFIEKDGK